MLTYIKGDLFEAASQESKSKRIICHVVNNISRMGSGFVVPLMKKWPIVPQIYHSQPALILGTTHFVQVEPEIWVANMVGQNKVVGPDNPKPIKYSALAKCMTAVADVVKDMGDCEIMAPKFGSGLAGGNWDLIEEMIKEIWDNIPVSVYVID